MKINKFKPNDSLFPNSNFKINKHYLSVNLDDGELVPVDVFNEIVNLK